MEKKRFDFSKLIGFNIYTIALILIVFLGGIGLTYAYYAFSYEEESVIAGNVINVDLDLEVDLVVGANEEMVPLQDAALSNALNAVGSTNGACVDSVGNLSCQVYKITLINKGSRVKHLEGTIELYPKEGTGNVYNNLKWQELKSPTTLKSDTLVNGMEKSTLVSRLTIKSKETKEWYIAVWISETDTDQRETDKGLFGGTVTFEVVEPTFDTGNVIIDSIMGPEAETDSFIDFSQTSEASNTNGVYIRNGTYDNEYPIYYYRGNVNNNIFFAKHCWKIVRTTETGGVKLIYNGLPNNGQCNNTGEATQIGTKEFNSSYKSLAYVGYMYSNPYEYSTQKMSSVTDVYIYGNDVTYSNGTYTLTDTITSSNWSSIYNGGLDNSHYTCFTTGTTCSSVYYIYYADSENAYYITLTNGKKVEDALVDMLGADDNNTDNYNTTSSTIKGNSTTEGTLDYWYYTNIDQKGYDKYIEDTVWCNDRSISSLGGWNLDGGDLTKFLYFEAHKRIWSLNFNPSLNCSRNIDKFTVSELNGNGNLDYPVGLLTPDEVMLAGGKTTISNSSYYLYSGSSYWIIAPVHFGYDGSYASLLNSYGIIGSSIINTVYGVRPSISLKTGFTLIGDGDGSATKPYVVNDVVAHTLTFDPNEGSVTTTDKQVISGLVYGDLPTPTRTGYTFDGWYTDKDAGVEVTSSTIVSDDSIDTLYARWTANTYTISFDANGGTGTMNDYTYVYDNSGSFTLPTSTFTRTGYTISKWRMQRTTDNKWYGCTDTSVACTSSAGNTTMGWYSASAIGTYYEPTANSTWGISKNHNYNMKFYAQWTANTYTITYYLGNATSTAGVTKLGTSSCTYDASCTLTKFANLGDGIFPYSSSDDTNYNWAFYGWSTSKTGTTRTYTNGQSFTYKTAGNLSLYALGYKNFNFYSTVAPTEVTNQVKQYWNPYSTSATYLTSITIPAASTINGWTFIGYLEGANTATGTVTQGVSKVGTSIKPAYSEGRTYRGVFSRRLIIVYEKGEGSVSGSVANQTGIQFYNTGYASSGVNKGAKVSTVEFWLQHNFFTRSGYTFNGWLIEGKIISQGGKYSCSPVVLGGATEIHAIATWRKN